MPPELVAEIRKTDVDGIPTETVLATSTPIAMADVTHDGFYNFVFGTPVVLPDAGARYAVVLLEQSPDPADPEVGWVTSTADDPYPDGEKWTGTPWAAVPDRDFFFKVF